jgi:hypothetical protein
VSTPVTEVATPVPAASWWYTVQPELSGVLAVDAVAPDAVAGSTIVIGTDRPSETRTTHTQGRLLAPAPIRRRTRSPILMPMAEG